MTRALQEDAGWHKQPPGVRKYHYFVIDGRQGYFHQYSLCGKHKERFEYFSDQRTGRPKCNGSECVACIRKFIACYGKGK